MRTQASSQQADLARKTVEAQFESLVAERDALRQRSINQRRELRRLNAQMAKQRYDYLVLAARAVELQKALDRVGTTNSRHYY